MKWSQTRLRTSRNRSGACSIEIRRVLPGLRLYRHLLAAAFLMPAGWAGEGPFFITYTHQMEEPGNLEIATKNVTGKPGDGRRFLGSTTELEYGIKGWWTTEFYLDGQATFGDSTLFT